MQRSFPVAALAALACCLGVTAALTSSASSPKASAPARLILAEVSVGGTIVLRGSTSDDGQPDADAVWRRLPSVQMSPTDAFAKLGVPDDAEEFEIRGTEAAAAADEAKPPRRARDVVFSIRYGGTATAYDVTIQRDGKARWHVQREAVDGYFSLRTISRYAAGRLKEPEAKR